MSEEFGQLGCQQFFIAEKTCHHGFQKFCWAQFFQIDRMSGPIRQHNDKGNLGSAIAIPERMNGIKFRQKVRSLNCEILLG